MVNAGFGGQAYKAASRFAVSHPVTLPRLLEGGWGAGRLVCRFERMKTTHSLIAAMGGLALALGGGLTVANWRTAEATAKTAHFARPAQALAATAPAAPDLTLFSAMADERVVDAVKNDLAACEAALSAAGVIFKQVPAVQEGMCGYSDAIEVRTSLADLTPNPGAPDSLPMTCDLAARLEMWERHVVIPVAEKYLGSPVKEIKAFGTFQCRTVAGRDRLSEHAFAKAADIASFVLADGREISVLDDYRAKDAKGDFLREVRQRACDLFDVTLGPDYNADHANHFHLDVGGNSACR